MNYLNRSLPEAVSDDDVFFGPVTEKEKLIKEQFECYGSSNETNIEPLQVTENEISINDSLYKSFPADNSTKYDSFEDSLNEDIEEKPQSTKHITLRKTLDRLKVKKHAFYDSLEDVCSLVSNIDKCSISCGVENDSNAVEKQHIVEDSLKAPAMVKTTKNNGASEQIHFDEDSLAIAEFENTFDDSLEDINMISSIESIEIEDINNQENVEIENMIVSNDVDQKPVLVYRNLFDTVEVIYEKSNFIKEDPDESCDSKNKLFDSLSYSECKDAFKDSLEESENGIAKLNSLKSDLNLPAAESKMIEKNELDMSVQIIYENMKNSSLTEDSSDSKYINASKDSLKNLKHNKSHTDDQPIKNLDVTEIPEKAVVDQEKLYAAENFLDASVQFLYERHKNSSYGETISTYDDALKDNMENLKSSSSCYVEKPAVKSTVKANTSKCSSSPTDVESVSQNAGKLSDGYHHGSRHISDNGILFNSDANNEGKTLKSNSTVSSDSYSVTDNCSNKKETISIDACQLKFLNDNLCFDKDFKLQFQIEVTVGDKKCKIEPENIKIIPVLGSNDNKKVSSPSSPVKSCSRNDDTISPAVFDEFSRTKMSNKENIKKRISLCDTIPSKNISLKANCIQMKDTSPILLTDSSTKRFEDLKTECGKSEISLLQALDLHDISLFLNDSIIQSKDSLMSLNLSFESKPQSSLLNEEIKENFPELSPSSYHSHKQYQCSSHSKASPYKAKANKTPVNLKDDAGSRENSAKRTGATRIPVRKVDKFALPVSSYKNKQIPVSAEKEKKCVHSPHSDSRKGTPGATPHKHHFCNVRNTIFSKVPQIVPSKKYINVQSPVAQYIRNAPSSTSVKTPVLEPILRDCMNDIRFHQQLESPYYPKGSSSKLTDKKA